MIIGVDASNIRSGGGLTHLSKLLNAFTPNTLPAKRIIVWGNRHTNSYIKNSEIVDTRSLAILDQSLFKRLLWRQKELPWLLKVNNCDVLFSPGGIIPFRNDMVPTIVTMSRNLLPFDNAAIAGYPLSQFHKKINLLVLRCLQTASFRRASGTLFLTEFAKDIVFKRTGQLPGLWKVVPHGLEDSFYSSPHKTGPVEYYCSNNPFRFLYVSTINYYKHQWNVAEAVGRLRHNGYPVSIDFVGPIYGGFDKLLNTMNKWDPHSSYMKYIGSLRHSQLPHVYKEADAFVFASSSETFGQVLLEAMASGLPIASSDIGAAREILGDNAVYFDQKDPKAIFSALMILLNNHNIRNSLAVANFEKARQYSWAKCADATFMFIHQVHTGNSSWCLSAT